MSKTNPTDLRANLPSLIKAIGQRVSEGTNAPIAYVDSDGDGRIDRAIAWKDQFYVEAADSDGDGTPESWGAGHFSGIELKSVDVKLRPMSTKTSPPAMDLRENVPTIAKAVGQRLNEGTNAPAIYFDSTGNGVIDWAIALNQEGRVEAQDSDGDGKPESWAVGGDAGANTLMRVEDHFDAQQAKGKTP